MTRPRSPAVPAASLAALVLAATLLAGESRPAELARLARLLDSERFALREHATRELTAAGQAALAPVRAVLADPRASLEAKRRATQVLDAYLVAQATRAWRADPRRAGTAPSFKALTCTKELDRWFPGYRFHLASSTADDRAAAGAFLAPDDRVVLYSLREEHREGQTALAAEIRRAGLKVACHADAQELALLWILLAHGNESFQVVKTDHRYQTRY